MRTEKPWEKGTLAVSENGRYFRLGEKPWFWLGDTAWLLFDQLSDEESFAYLRNRKDLGFNIILADLIHTADQKNLAGQKALKNQDPTQPDIQSGFWDHIDRVIRMAEDLGLYMGILPVWGSSLVGGDVLTEKNVDAYLDFVLKRFHDAPNIVWIVGGDVRGDRNRAVFCRMGERMKADRSDRLVGYHPFGRTTSAFWFHEEPWLDFNLFQSGHRRYDQVNLAAWDDNMKTEGCFGEDNYRYVNRDYGRTPAKPVLDGEPSYEWIVQGLHDNREPYWKAADVRRYAYWSVFAGAAGHTYGHNSIMQFYRDCSVPGAFGAKFVWSDAMQHPGAAEMGHLKRLMESVDFEKAKPRQDLLIGNDGEKYDYILALGGENWLFVYTYTGKPVTVSLVPFAGQRIGAWWMDPVTGGLGFAEELTGRDTVTMTPPWREDGSDAVLVIREIE